MLEPAPTTVVYRYPPMVAARYRRRGWIAVALGGLLGAFILVVPFISSFSFASPLQPWLIVVLVIIAPVIPLISLRAAITARSRWGDDDGLAIAIADDGITLPRVGLLPWSRICGIREETSPMFLGNPPHVYLQLWLGTRDTAKLCVYVKDTAEQITAMPLREHRHLVGGGPNATFGWATAFWQGLSDADYRAAVSTTVAAAQARGIPTDW